MTAAAVLDRLADAGVVLALDGDGLSYRAPRGALTPALRADLAAYREDIITLLSGPPEPASTSTVAAPTPPERRAIPAGCLAPITCPALGICGRPSCIPVDELPRWADAVAAARAADNPHRVPDFDDAKGSAA